MEREKLDKDYKDTKISIKSIATALAQLNTDDEDEEQSFRFWRVKVICFLNLQKIQLFNKKRNFIFKPLYPLENPRIQPPKTRKSRP